MSYKEKVSRKENNILQVPNANIRTTVEKNKSLGEKIFMCPKSSIFRLELHHIKRERAHDPFFLISIVWNDLLKKEYIESLFSKNSHLFISK